MIATFESRFGGLTLLEHALRSPSSIGDLTPPRDAIAAAPVLLARVNLGRWIVDCPTEGCGGAEYAAPLVDGIPVFFCCECRNQASGGQPLPVAWPAERDEIELTLSLRPAPATRNWQPGEPLAALLAENIAHGLEA